LILSWPADWTLIRWSRERAERFKFSEEKVRRYVRSALCRHAKLFEKLVIQLIHQGVPPNRLVAAGFGEFQPINNGDRLKLTEK
jgi:hypothetical protein